MALLFTDCDVKADTDGARAARIIDDLENFIVYICIVLQANYCFVIVKVSVRTKLSEIFLDCNCERRASRTTIILSSSTLATLPTRTLATDLLASIC